MTPSTARRTERLRNAFRLSPFRLRDGRVDLGVVVLAAGDEGTFEADPATEQMLLESIAQCERGQTVSADRLLAELRERR